jgi:hypothetical protein
MHFKIVKQKYALFIYLKNQGKLDFSVEFIHVHNQMDLVSVAFQFLFFILLFLTFISI